jgi:ABC-type branched-subunit amino acid transport system substrate-binding protein
MRLKHAIVVGLVAALVGVTVAVSASAGGDSKSAKEPIHFALVAIQFPGLDLLGDMGTGADAAAKYINTHGGFGGRQVVIDKCNSQYNPATALACAHTTLDKKPFADFGCDPTWSQGGLALYGRSGIPSFNCPNTPTDFTYRWSFGIAPGAFGFHRAVAKYLCTRSDVHNVVMLGLDSPQQRHDEPAAVQPILQGCGKSVDFIFAPAGGVDYTPYVQQALSKKPDFIITNSSDAGEIGMFKALSQQGWPASKASSVSCGYNAVLQPAGSTMDGVICTDSFKSWDDTKDPEVAAYIKAVKAVSSKDPRNHYIQWGYHSVMWFYTIAKTIGFAKFTPQTMAFFMRNRSNVHMPLSRSLVNPGPRVAPQVKQPWVVFSQWKNGKMTPMPVGPKKDGWILGF